MGFRIPRNSSDQVRSAGKYHTHMYEGAQPYIQVRPECAHITYLIRLILRSGCYQHARE